VWMSESREGLSRLNTGKRFGGDGKAKDEMRSPLHGSGAGFSLSKTIDELISQYGGGSAKLFSACVQNLSGCGIQDQPAPVLICVEVKHSVQRAGDGIRRAAADSAQVPIVLDEPEDR
jgi:hypothetical protein